MKLATVPDSRGMYRYTNYVSVLNKCFQVMLDNKSKEGKSDSLLVTKSMQENTIDNSGPSAKGAHLGLI